MAKQSAPIQEVSRLLDLVPYLSTHSHISLKELSKEFGVDEKSMANELTALSMCGLPGYTPYELIEIFFDSGFVTINNHEALDIPRALTNVEVASLLIGLEILRESATEADSQTITKIDQLIRQMRDLVGSSIVLEEDPQISHKAMIENAIASRRSIRIEYLSPLRDEVTVRDIDPLAFEVDRGFTYLSAFCHLHKSVRNFRLDRIQSATITDISFPKEPLPLEIPQERVLLSLTASGSRRAIAELFSMDNLPAGGDFEIEVYSPEWAAKAVIAHSPDLRLNKPEEIRREIRRGIENILALYAP